MVWPAVIAAGASLASSLLSGSMSKDAAESNTAAQIAWNREAAQNKHQWEVQDLRKAGLNPILSATNGSALPSISPPMPSFPTADFSPAVQAYSASNLKRMQESQQTKIAEEIKGIQETVRRQRLENERLQMEIETLRKNPQFIEFQQISDSPWKLIPMAFSKIFGESTTSKSFKEHYKFEDSR